MFLSDADFKLTTATAASTDWCVSYSDSNGVTSFALGSEQGNVAAATTTTMLSVASTTVATVKSVLIRNASTSTSQTVTLKVTTNIPATITVTPAISIGPGETVQWQDGVITKFVNGSMIQTAGDEVGRAIYMRSGMWALGVSSVKSMTTGVLYGFPIGRAPRRLTSVSLMYRVATAAVTITYYEIGLWRADPAMLSGANGGVNGEILGATDVSAVVNSTGIKTTVVTPTLRTIEKGDYLFWYVIGAATTMAAMRSIGADPTQSDWISGTTVSYQPSLRIGAFSPTAIDSTTGVPVWSVATMNP